LYRLDTSPRFVGFSAQNNTEDAAALKHHQGQYVPFWDFDAPAESLETTARDSSAGAIAANGMLILSQALAGAGDDSLSARFRTAAVDIVRDTLEFALAPETAGLRNSADNEIEVEDTVAGNIFEAILKFGTANNNTNARKQYANHGLVYGDYYLVEFGNRLLRMGLV
jgi:hypothetical protein